MGKLAHVQRQLSSRNNGSDVVSALNTVKTLVDELSSPGVSPDQFKGTMRTFARGLSNLSKQLNKATDSLNSNIAALPTDFVPVLTAIDTLQGQLGKLTSAINGISIPAPVVNVDKPDPVDFAPVMSEINALRQDMGQMSFDLPLQQVDERPRQWSFDVKRKRNGYDITAKAT
jgi:hypothetical protein